MPIFHLRKSTIAREPVFRDDETHTASPLPGLSPSLPARSCFGHSQGHDESEPALRMPAALLDRGKSSRLLQQVGLFGGVQEREREKLAGRGGFGWRQWTSIRRNSKQGR